MPIKKLLFLPDEQYKLTDLYNIVIENSIDMITIIYTHESFNHG